MTDITTYPFIRHFRAEPTAYVLRYRRGRLIAEGPGLAFWFRALHAAVAELPVDDRELPFLFHVRSADFQELTVQGAISFRVADPKRLAERVDFTVDVRSGRWREAPLEQVAALLSQLAQQFVIDELARHELQQALARGVAPLRERIAAGLTAEPALAELGLELVAVRVAAVAPASDVEKALRQPTREAIQQAADVATFARRAMAVEKERGIAENELQNRIELARREEQLVEQDGANARLRAQEDADTHELVQNAHLRVERERAGTREQLRFFLTERGCTLEELVERHERVAAALRSVHGAIPPDWRRATVARAELDRFLFAADDVVVVLGQDGLVANVAKYLGGQPVIGLNPEPERWPGVLVPHAPEAADDLLQDVAAERATLQERTMVEARLDDGQRLLALNEVFLGHASHQSARYALELGGERERQSSSGVIVSTGTGATGWAASIARERRSPLALPQPGDRAIAFYVREAWPSAATGTRLTEGLLRDGATLRLQSEMGEGGVVFGDGIEDDRLQLDWGRRVHVAVARERLRLVL